MGAGEDTKRAAGDADAAPSGLAPAPRRKAASRGDAPANLTTADTRKARWACVQGLLTGNLHPRRSDAVARHLEGMLDERLAELIAGDGSPLVLIEATPPASGEAVDETPGTARKLEDAA